MLKVSFLAKEFDLTKATISDSVRVLIKKELLIKIPDTYDSRSYTIALTQKGKEITKKTSSFTNNLDDAVGSIDDNKKGDFLNNLLDIIHYLNKSDIISTQRMCLTCHHYQHKNNVHFCNLLDKKLYNKELQIDCTEHQIR